MIAIRNLAFGYDRDLVLDGVDADFPVGVTAVVGANGAGKTTLIRILAGLLHPDMGSVTYSNGSEGGGQIIAPHIGYLPQGARPTSLLTARDYVEYIAYLRGARKASVANQVTQALAAVGLLDDQHARTSRLSGGMFRRVVLAAALVSDPPILLLDEPTSSLDPVQRVQLRELVQQTKRDRIVVMATHLLEDVAQVADQVLVLSGSRVVFAGTPTEMAATSGRAVSDALGQSLEAAMIAMIQPDLQ
jgi:ABC-2 type transport system ATP-binding protein